MLISKNLRCRMLFTFGLAAFLIIFNQALRAAEFIHQPANAFGPVSIGIKGQIKPGDYDRFKDFLLLPDNLKAYTNYVWLDSTGGNLTEAMRFAMLFEKSSASVVVGQDARCYSACFMLFASGVDRWLYPFGELGVHQVSVQFPASIAGLDAAVKKGLVQAVTNDASAYLAQQGIPLTLITKMQETPASQMYIIDTLMLKREGWQRGLAIQPKFLAAVEAACGKQPDVPTHAEWNACKIDFQTKAAKRFVSSELTLLAAGKPSILFSADKLNEAKAAVDAMK